MVKHMIGFTKEERSSFGYWFAHWCAFQMTALNLHIWKPKYLLHDIEKPWLKLIWKDYSKVQAFHRTHNNHHVEYLFDHDIHDFDIDAYIIDNECSRFTKQASPVRAREFIPDSLNAYTNSTIDTFLIVTLQYLKCKAIERMTEIGL